MSKKITIKRPARGPQQKIGTEQQAPLQPAPQAAPPPVRKGPGSGPLIVKLSVVGIIAIGGLIFFLKVRREAEVRPRLLAIQRKTLVDATAASCKNVESEIDRLVRVDTQAQALLEQAKQDYMTVLDEPLQRRKIQLTSKTKTLKQPSEGKSKASATGIQTDSDGRDAPFGMPTREQLDRARQRSASSSSSKVVAPPAVRAAKPAGQAQIDEDDRDVPAGMLSRAELERRRAGADAAPAAPDPDMPGGGAEPGVQAPASMAARPGLNRKAELPIEQQDIHDAGKALLVSSTLIHIARVDGEDLLATSSNHLAEAEQTLEFYRLEEIDKDVKGCIVSAQRLAKDSEEELEKAERAAKRIAELRKKHEEDQKEAARVAEEKRQAEALKQLIAKETAWVQEDLGAARTHLENHTYSMAVDELRQSEGRYTSDQGQASFKALLDKYIALQELKAFLVQEMNGTPFSWGWGEPPTARDVLGSDEHDIQLRGAQVSWTDVTTEQMKKFVDHYTKAAKLTRQKLARQELAAAFYFDENGEETLAREYADKAIGTDPPLRRDVDRMLGKP